MNCRCLSLLTVFAVALAFAPVTLLAADSDDVDLIKQLTAPKPKKPAAPTAAQKQAKLRVEIQSLFVEFQKPYEAGRRTNITSRLLKHGPEVAQRLVKQVARDFQSRYRSYLDDFHKAATQTARSRQGAAANAQIEPLRKAVLALSGIRDLSKAQIVQTGDPAMQKLEQLLTVSSESLLSRSERLKLGARRQELLELIQIWAKAHKIAGANANNGSGRTLKLATPPDAAKFETELSRLESFTAQLGTPMSTADQQTLVANFRLQSQLDSAEFDGVLKLNMMRIRLGLNALAIDVKLSQAARGHSKDMKEHKFFSHTSPLPGKARFTDRAGIWIRFPGTGQRQNASCELRQRTGNREATHRVDAKHGPRR